MLSVERRDGAYRVRSLDSKEAVEVATSDDVKRRVAERAQKSAAKGEPLRLELRGFSSDEARVLVQNAELQARADVVGLVHNMDAGRAKSLLSAKADFKRWKLGAESYEVLADGRSIFHLTVDIPVTAKRTSSIRMRIELLLDRIVPEAVRKALVQEISAVLKKLFNRSATVERMAFELKKELRKTSAAHQGDLQIVLSGQSDDVTVVQRDDVRRGRAGALG
ncbi:hypothetical protein WMF30_51615 [Sorangium sp. So ce134]